jgi:hypothetical protein
MIYEKTHDCSQYYSSRNASCSITEHSILGDSFAPSDPDVLQEMYLLHTNVNLYVCQRAQLL